MFGLFKRNEEKNLKVNEIDDLIGKVELIDIREPYEYQSGSIRTAKNIPMNTLIEHADRYLKKGNEYYILCQSGNRSSRTCTALTRQGYDVINVTGGVSGYSGSNRI